MFRKIIAIMLCASLIGGGFAGPAQAAVIGTQQALAADGRAALLDEVQAKLALGNLAYREGRHEISIRHYRERLQRAPEDPVLVNNLASVLGESGCPRHAEAILQPAPATLPAESPWQAAIAGTLAELKARRDPDGAHWVRWLAAEGAEKPSE